METTLSHYNNWWAVLVWTLLFVVFLMFIPFYKKSHRRPASAYIAFILAFALEMFGVPFSLYIVTWAFGLTLPEGVLWGHTLINQIGYWGMYIAVVFYVIGGLLIISGWKIIHKNYWSKEEGKGKLVTHGIYAHIRHPQYTGFLLITLGMIAEWATIPVIIMWPILLVIYYRLARKEERDMEKEFGQEYIEYKRKTSMFLPLKSVNKKWAIGIISSLLIVVLVLVGMSQIDPPKSVPASALADRFSAERAMVHLRVISKTPHPMGSPEHAEVEQYIVKQLTDMGLNPEVQVANYSVDGLKKFNDDIIWSAEVHNIVARIPGTANTGAILLAAGYDSMPTSPNAGDGCIGASALIETVRAIKAGQPLKNDVLIVFHDADVAGLLGSGAFKNLHPRGNDYSLVMLFYGLGNKGASVIASTSRENGWLLNEAIKASPYPFANSLINEILMGGRGFGDLYSYVDENSYAMGFANFKAPQVYHTMSDSPYNTDMGTVQHHGFYMHSLTRHFGNIEMVQMKAPDLVAFNILPGYVVSYSSTWVVPIVGLVTLFFIVAIALGFRRKELTVRGILLGILFFIASLIITALVATLGWMIIRQINPYYHVFMAGGYYKFQIIGIGIFLLNLAALAAFYKLLCWKLSAKHNGFNLAFGALFIWWLLMILTGITMPGASYLFTLPLLISLMVVIWMFLLSKKAENPWSRAIALIIGIAPAVILFAPVVYFLFNLMVSFRADKGGMPMIAVPILLATLPLGLLLPHLWFFVNDGKNEPGKQRWHLPATALVFSLIFIIAGIMGSSFSPDQPKTNYIAYMLDADENKAAWYSTDEKLDSFTGQFFTSGAEKTTFVASPGYFSQVAFPAYKASAPVVSLPVPEMDVLSDMKEGDKRTLHFRVISKRGAPNVHTILKTDGKFLAASVNGVEIQDSLNRDHLNMINFAVPAEGIDLTVTIQPANALTITVTDYSNGLPDVPGMMIQPRSASMMPAPYDFNDPTVVKNTFMIN